MKVIALMQNQWFKDAEGARRIMARYDAMEPSARMDFRRRWIKRTLFGGCRSGRVLTSYLTPQIIDRIIWEEASTSIGDKPEHCPPAEPAHIKTVLEHHRPQVVAAFGRTAREGLRIVMDWEPVPFDFNTIIAPHPACRAPSDHAALKQACLRLRHLLEA